jgi:uncharacterized membrane protein
MSDRPAVTSSWPARLLICYPPHWRARYGEELGLLITDLLDHGRPAVPMAADVLGGAVAAWISERGTGMTQRSRGALIAVLWNWVAFAAVAAWFGHDLGSYPTAIEAQQMMVSHPAVPDAYHVLMASGSVGVVATAVAAIAFAIDAAKHAWRQGRRSTFVLMAVPLVVAAVWLGGVRLLPFSEHTASGLALSVTWLLAGVAGIAVSTQAVVTVVKRSEFSERTWRIAAAAAAAVVAAMFVATGATITWGVVARTSLAHPGDASGWLVVTAILAVTTVRAVLALLGGRLEPAEHPAVA